MLKYKIPQIVTLTQKRPVTSLCFSGLSILFQKNFKKIVEYIWIISEKRVLLHPLSKRGQPCRIDLMTKRRTALL